jgi:hypothetical protein
VSLERPNTPEISFEGYVPRHTSYATSLSETGALISARPVSVTIRTDDGGNAAIAVYNLLAKLQLSFLYVIGVILMGFEHMRNIVKVMKPVRVAAIES